jgi:hypothetical protein
MAQDRSSPNADEPIADDPLAGLRKLAGVARELGVTDVGTFTEALDAARADGRGAELFKPLKALVEQFAGQSENTKSLGDLGARLKDLVSGRETVADIQRKVEVGLLRRIEELTGTAPIEGVLDLATAYARIRSAGIAGADASDDRSAGTPPRKLG